jgi:hypothetical protein
MSKEREGGDCGDNRMPPSSFLQRAKNREQRAKSEEQRAISRASDRLDQVVRRFFYWGTLFEHFREGTGHKAESSHLDRKTDSLYQQV